MRFEAAKTLPGLISVAAIAAATMMLASPRTLTGNPTGNVPFEFPEELGRFTGSKVRFCQNDQCSFAFAERLCEAAATNEWKCPECGSETGFISLGEQKLLPPSTPIFRMEYDLAGHPSITATLVFSGIERRSIHRPQVCLKSQGHQITDEYSHFVDLGNGKTFEIRVLEASTRRRGHDGKTFDVNPFVYCYWLFNPERETTSHYGRFRRMMFDNCFRAYRPRWGYASITISVDPKHPDEWKHELEMFLPLFYPLVTDIREKLDAQRNITTTLTGWSSEANTYEGEGPVNRQE